MARAIAAIAMVLVAMGAGAAPSDTGLRPQWQADGALFVPKALQRQLGLRTQAIAVASPTRTLRQVAEVVADPRSLGSIKAPQAGTLEAAERWILPGQAVRAGEVLAWLRPLMAQRETTRRRAELARIEQRLLIARMNYERLRLQADGLGGPAPNNLYFEQAELEQQALLQQQALAQEGLAQRVPLRAPAGGVLAVAPAREGEVVAAGQPLFDIADPARLQLAVLTQDPALAAAVIDARLPLAGGEALPLVLSGSEPLAGQAGWRLLFDAAEPPPSLLLPGVIREIEIVAAGPEPALSRQACVTLPGGGAVLWLHVAPERFAPRALRSCEGEMPVATAGERWVVQGAALLQQYR